MTIVAVSTFHEARSWRNIAITLNIMKQHFIPREAILDELEKKAADAEQGAATKPEPRATELREEAKLYREWAASLRSGRWTS